MRRYIKDNQLFFETDKATYTVICSVELLKDFQDFYVEDENGTFGNREPINEPYDSQTNGYYNYFIYKAGDEKDLDLLCRYIGEPTENFSVEWVENTIKEYEEENK